MRLDHYVPHRHPPGRIQRQLRRLGPTWGSAPARRMVQAACFALFLFLFFHVCWPYGSADYAATLAAREKLPAESFLALDPLVSISTAIAARTWVFSLAWAAVILALCVLVPRGFCGYICPLGTLIDLFDWSVGRRITRFRVEADGWWTHLKYYLLAATLAAAVMGIMLAGFVAAIPIITRALQFVLAPVQLGSLRGWYLVPPMNAGHWVSIGLFLGVLALGLLRPRFWCRHLCPTGAVFAIANALRISERKVDATCIDCGRCARICPFDAIRADYATRTADCTLCQTCGGVCPPGSIHFVSRWAAGALRASNTPIGREAAFSRRGLLTGLAVGAGLALGMRHIPGGRRALALPVVRPPGSVPEADFNQLCIRCGECFQVCPNNVLQPIGFERGLDDLWTPKVVADWSGCEPACNNCGQVCPTGAIRALSIEEKRAARMGLAIVDEAACLPHALREDCQRCVDECAAAGYDAIEFRRVGVAMDADGMPLEGSGFLAPVVLAENCVGCGLCQTRCHVINVREKKLLKQTAILIMAGEGREDRLRRGSYLALREQERGQRQQAIPAPGGDSYLPDFLR
jgi:ferredoxin